MIDVRELLSRNGVRLSTASQCGTNVLPPTDAIVVLNCDALVVVSIDSNHLELLCTHADLVGWLAG